MTAQAFDYPFTWQKLPTGRIEQQDSALCGFTVSAPLFLDDPQENPAGIAIHVETPGTQRLPPETLGARVQFRELKVVGNRAGDIEIEIGRIILYEIADIQIRTERTIPVKDLHERRREEHLKLFLPVRQGERRPLRLHALRRGRNPG